MKLAGLKMADGFGNVLQVHAGPWGAMATPRSGREMQPHRPSARPQAKSEEKTKTDPKKTRKR
jgi:hypothetical protein